MTLSECAPFRVLTSILCQSQGHISSKSLLCVSHQLVMSLASTAAHRSQLHTSAFILPLGVALLACPCTSGFFVHKSHWFSVFSIFVGDEEDGLYVFDMSESRANLSLYILCRKYIRKKIAESSAHILKLNNTLINNRSKEKS